MILKPESVILGLIQPEYMSVPEGFISTLAWKAFSTEGVGKTDSAWLRYNQRLGKPPHSKVTLTEPSGNSKAILLDALTNGGLSYRSDDKKAAITANAILNSIYGLQTANSNAVPVSPLTPSLALLQNARGLMSKPSPANYAQIFENVFSIGDISNKTPKEETGVVKLWLAATTRHLESSPILTLIDNAIQAPGVTPLGARTLLDDDPKRITVTNPLIQSFETDTPFNWFNKAWKRLTSEPWVDSLPSKVWIDWASTVMRTSMGLTYLWEASFYHAVADQILSDDAAMSNIFTSSLETVPWVPRSEGVELRDVSSKLKRRVATAQKIKKYLDELQKNSSTETLDDFLTAMSGDAKVKDKLRELQSAKHNNSASDNYWEAIRFSLMIRSSTATNTDHYGLLRKHGNRYSLVDPATEWIACVASLSSPTPTSQISLGEIIRDLRSLGLKPNMRELIGHLERAGMARGSDDADLGLMVETAY
jgi:hypothetical protein